MDSIMSINMSPERDLPLVAIIPARAGSKRLPGKNVRRLAGKPLYEYSIDCALEFGADDCIISTDIAEILERRFAPPVRAVARPAELSGDEVPMADVLSYVVDNFVPGPARIVLLQPTSPMRSASDVSEAVAVHQTGHYDLVMGVTQADPKVLKWGMLDGQRFVSLSRPEFCFANYASLPPVYRPTGSVYVFSADWFRSSRSLVSSAIGCIEIPPDRSHDIDDISDFERLEIECAEHT